MISSCWLSIKDQVFTLENLLLSAMPWRLVQWKMNKGMWYHQIHTPFQGLNCVSHNQIFSVDVSRGGEYKNKWMNKQNSVLQNVAAVTKEVNGICKIGLLLMYNYCKAIINLISCLLTIHLLIPICKCLRWKVYILFLFCNLGTESRNHEHMPLFRKKSPSPISQHLFTLNVHSVVLYNCMMKGSTIMGFVFYARHVLALLVMSNCSHCWKHGRSTKSDVFWPRVVALYGLVFRGVGFASVGTLTSQAAYRYTCISWDRKSDTKSPSLAPFCHAILSLFDLRLQASTLCLVKAFSWCCMNYFCPLWAYVCFCSLFIKTQQSWHWFGAMLWVMLRYVWTPSPIFLFLMRLTRVFWKLFTLLSCIWKRDLAKKKTAREEVLYLGKHGQGLQWGRHAATFSRCWVLQVATWSSWICSCLLQGSWTRLPLKVSSNLKHSMILWFCDRNNLR